MIVVIGAKFRIDAETADFGVQCEMEWRSDLELTETIEPIAEGCHLLVPI